MQYSEKVCCCPQPKSDKGSHNVNIVFLCLPSHHLPKILSIPQRSWPECCQHNLMEQEPQIPSFSLQIGCSQPQVNPISTTKYVVDWSNVIRIISWYSYPWYNQRLYLVNFNFYPDLNWDCLHHPSIANLLLLSKFSVWFMLCNIFVSDSKL